MRRVFRVFVLFAWFSISGTLGASAQETAWPPIERSLPPLGIEIDRTDADRLLAEVARLEAERDKLLAASLVSRDELPDVEIYLKAVRRAVEDREFTRPQEVKQADELLAIADKRLQALRDKRPDWVTAHGLVVRGYRSRVDGSVQPYGLVIPEKLPLDKPVPLYIWLHGRNDKQADLQFLIEHAKQPGQFKPDNAIVLHPYGRGCLGWKGTAEIDVLEAVESVQGNYKIDPNRIVLAGFSMGGAGTWHMGAHYADRFTAVHAGAGFVDVARYQKLTPDKFPPLYEQVMWHNYNVPDYVRNLFNVPVVAYSGEVDKQKDAADFMGEAFTAEGRQLEHLIGPGMGHKYHPEVLKQVLARLDAAVQKGRDTRPRQVSLQTRTLRYDRMHWVQALELDEHWQDSRIDAALDAAGNLKVETKNVRRLHLAPPGTVAAVSIDGQSVSVPEHLGYAKHEGRWRPDPPADESAEALPRKHHGQQGPIDDAFLEPFLVVVPTGKSSPEVDRWVAFELEHLKRRWRQVFRGELRIKNDVDVTDDDCCRYHLAAWGDPQSNALIRRVADRLPVRWQGDTLHAAGQQLPASSHLPLLIYPNPLKPRKYLVLNSGPTHREAHDRTNSLQNPKLGDWAIVDIRVPPNADAPGKILSAGLFNDDWQFAPSAK